jgi:hypothetical protein
VTKLRCQIEVMLVHRRAPGFTEEHVADNGEFRDEIVVAYRFVDISNDRTTNNQESCPLESCQDSKNKERCEIWC